MPPRMTKLDFFLYLIFGLLSMGLVLLGLLNASEGGID
jgi:hypothetical protein